MGLFSKLLGKKESDSEIPQTETVEYNGYQIKPAPRKQGGQYVTAGYICKIGESGDVQEHHFIRADTHADIDSANQHAIFKGKQIINERGDGIFE